MERVVLVHGFTQTSASWGPVAERLARRFEVVPVDLPGHGGSGAVKVGFAEAAGLVGGTGGPAAYVGYSLGGRLCLRLALDRPDLVRALVLIGGAPGIAHAGGGGERRGRLCRRLALAGPGLGGPGVVIGGSPGIADAGGRAGRRAADERLARRI